MACASYRPSPVLLRQSLELLSCFGIRHLRILCLLLLPPPWSYTCKPLCLAFILWLWRLNLRPSWLQGKHLPTGLSLCSLSLSVIQMTKILIAILNNTKQCHLFFFILWHQRQRASIVPTELYPLLWSLIRFWTWETVLDGNEGLARPYLVFPASSNQERAGTGSWCTSDYILNQAIYIYVYICICISM